nr:MAG TPA: hypothetical protein [Caudoviricetes sp.]
MIKTYTKSKKYSSDAFYICSLFVPFLFPFLENLSEL